MSIIISKNGKKAVRVDKSDFDKEDYLQQYIHENPESIPLYDIKEDIKLLILAREFPTNSGPIDAIGIDKDGEIYIVETKLYKNPDKRTVIAQALDYGAALWKHSGDFAQFVSTLESSVSKTFTASLAQKLQEFFELAEEETAALLESVRKNLSDGAFRFVVLMDQLDDRLKDLVVYVNQNSQFDVYAVELEYYKYEANEIIIPKIFGAEVKKGVVRSSSKRKIWDEGQFMNEINKNFSGKELNYIKKLYNFCKSNSIIYWGTGNTRGSFNPVVEKISENKSIITVRSNGVLSLNFHWLNESKNTEEYRDLFGKLIEEKTGLKLQNDWKEHFATYKLKEWGEFTDKLIEVIEELIKK